MIVVSYISTYKLILKSIKITLASKCKPNYSCLSVWKWKSRVPPTAIWKKDCHLLGPSNNFHTF